MKKGFTFFGFILLSILFFTSCSHHKSNPTILLRDASRLPASSEQFSIGTQLLEPISNYGLSYKLVRVYNVREDGKLYTDETNLGKFKDPSGFKEYVHTEAYIYRSPMQKLNGDDGHHYSLGDEVLLKTDLDGTDAVLVKIYDLTADGFVRIDSDPTSKYISIENIRPNKLKN